MNGRGDTRDVVDSRLCAGAHHLGITDPRSRAGSRRADGLLKDASPAIPFVVAGVPAVPPPCVEIAFISSLGLDAFLLSDIEWLSPMTTRSSTAIRAWVNVKRKHVPGQLGLSQCRLRLFCPAGQPAVAPRLTHRQ